MPGLLLQFSVWFPLLHLCSQSVFLDLLTSLYIWLFNRDLFFSPLKLTFWSCDLPGLVKYINIDMYPFWAVALRTSVTDRVIIIHLLGFYPSLSSIPLQILVRYVGQEKNKQL